MLSSQCILAVLLCAQAVLGFSVAGHQQQQPPLVSTCEANGSVYYVGEWYFLDSDQCTQCECTAEGPECARTECTSLPAACIHVSHYPSDCCPRCERIGCEYRGVVYDLGQNFQPSECEQCTCDISGIARCLVADCAPPPCVNPVYQPGKCCPDWVRANLVTMYPVHVFTHLTFTIKSPNCYTDSSLWVDSCTKCRCHDGQDAGYWEGNRLATCSRLKNCTPEQSKTQN
uniref:Zgc:113531 n=1 Tax=Hippocampus comes TaxID=109280 RepID=A0A3Q2YZN3_HIPCM